MRLIFRVASLNVGDQFLGHVPNAAQERLRLALPLRDPLQLSLPACRKLRCSQLWSDKLNQLLAFTCRMQRLPLAFDGVGADQLLNDVRRVAGVPRPCFSICESSAASL